MNSELLKFEQDLVQKKVFVTGHTGFTGGWACMWLKSIGASVYGYALEPEARPNLYEALNLNNEIQSEFGDICNYEHLLNSIEKFQPDLILHLAAQPLVRRSYSEPLKTFLVNTQGTVHLLEAARSVKSVKGVLCITTDKVYQNNEWQWPYREVDPLGGKDPYSASKAAAEMVINSYMASYSWKENNGPVIASARGGNIIGGGDWSEDRLIPDFVRAVVDGSSLKLRYPDAIRPWQHVLALVHGYLVILSGLISSEPSKYSRPWNLGPQDLKQYSVREVLKLMGSHWKEPTMEFVDNPLPEAKSLALDSSLARNELKWISAWDTAQVVSETASWYQRFYEFPEDARDITLAQISKWRNGIA